MASSVLAVERPLENGYFKWLLHFGPSPTDKIIQGVTAGDHLELFGGEAKIRPKPGDIYDFSDGGWYRATTDLMIWTPQYSADGFFANEQHQDKFIHYYHIYIFSPEQRQARLQFRAYQNLQFWNNGEMILDISGWDWGNERYEDFLLRKGMNSMTFKISGPGLPQNDHFLAARITDRSNNEYPDLTYSLSPPLPVKDVSMRRLLPAEYDPGHNIDVTLSLEIAPEATANKLTIIEYIPKGLSVADPGGGSVIGNSVQWLLAGDDLQAVNIQYSLDVPSSYKGTTAFLGYMYHDKKLEEIIGDSVLHQVTPAYPWDVADIIETIDINAGDYVRAENVTVGGVKDYWGILEEHGYGLIFGLKPNRTGGWGEYEFSVTNTGQYHIVLDYVELWTMFHHAAEVDVTIDDNITLTVTLFPTTHCYGFPYTNLALTRPQDDPDRKTMWIVGSVHLDAGSHTLRLTFPQMYPADAELDSFTDGRPGITKIILTNYPGLTLPYLAEPHHLDSYEHAPARLVHDRKTVELSDDRVEMTFYGTFYSLSQGNEIYFADGHVRPRPGETNTKFEIVSIEPEVFYLPPGGEQDFTLVVRSKESLSGDHSELVVVWLQGVPSSLSRRPYLFSTAQSYITLPPYKQQEFAWEGGTLFSAVQGASRYVMLDVRDPAVMFIPSVEDLGFDRGRYRRDVPQFFKDQFAAGLLPSVEKIIEHPLWDHYYPGELNWAQIWSAILASTYWREDNPQGGRFDTSNTKQARAYVKRLSENMVFYPVMRRWDWGRPNYLPDLHAVVGGISALVAHIRTAQENMIDDKEQFKILHNLVLPIFNSYWDEFRTTAVLKEDANEGDDYLRVTRSFYGPTGSPTDGFIASFPAYIKIGGDPRSMYGVHRDAETIALWEPLPRAYPKGTLITSWYFAEDWELECRDLMSLLAIGAASRDWAVVGETMSTFSEILEKQKIYLEDGSFRNEPGSYGGGLKQYPLALLRVRRLLGPEALGKISQVTRNKLRNALIYGLEFPFSNGKVPHLNGGGCMNQLGRGYHGDVRILEELFPEDQDNIALYERIAQQEANRFPGDIIDNHNFVIHGWGYAMLRSENGSWDRGMETLLSSKYLLSDPGDHVSKDCLGIVVYGLGAILTPRYGYSWIGYQPPFLNQVMVDDNRENRYYGSFWHFDGRKELPSAVAHTGDGVDSSELPFRRSRWDIQFPEYLFDAYFIDANDGSSHQYDWCFINMGDLDVVEPFGLYWSDYDAFLSDYWPVDRGAGNKTIASKSTGRHQVPGKIVADWRISNEPWNREVHTNETLLRNPPQHSGKLRLIMSDNDEEVVIKAEIGWYTHPNGEQTLANSQDILVVRKNAVSHAFIDTLEPIADDEEAYVKDVVVVEKGNHNQQLVKVVTDEGEDWVYLSGQWGARPDGDQPVAGIITDADILAWRVVDKKVTRFYIAGGSYADTPHGSWDFGSQGNHYVSDETTNVTADIWGLTKGRTIRDYGGKPSRFTIDDF